MWDGTCYTHAPKNVFKWADKVLPKEECKCAKKSTKNHRFTAPLPGHMHAWVCHLLKQAELMYLPEKTEGYCAPGAYPVSVMDEARASRRDAAIEYFGKELDVMLQHFLGNHTRCSHKPITDEQAFSCSGSAQVDALTQYLGTLKDKAPMLLSPNGIVHVQYVEINQSVIARVRKKPIPMSAAACFLGEATSLLCRSSSSSSPRKGSSSTTSSTSRTSCTSTSASRLRLTPTSLRAR